MESKLDKYLNKLSHIGNSFVRLLNRGRGQIYYCIGTYQGIRIQRETIDSLREKFLSKNLGKSKEEKESRQEILRATIADVVIYDLRGELNVHLYDDASGGEKALIEQIFL